MKFRAAAAAAAEKVQILFGFYGTSLNAVR